MSEDTGSTNISSLKSNTTPQPLVNSTDATRGEPLAVRARLRRAELEEVLAGLPVDALRTRGDIELALTTIDELTTGDTEHLADATAADINRWLEGSKHLGESHTAKS